MSEFIVYVKTDENGNIVDVNSSVFLEDTTDWIEIDRGTGIRYYHAQGNYFPSGIMDNKGIWKYKLVNGRPVERTVQEMDEDFSMVPPPRPADSERIRMLEEQNEMLISCLLEMSEVVYA